MCATFHLEPATLKNFSDHCLRVVLLECLFRVSVQVADDVVEVSTDLFHPRLCVFPGLQVLRTAQLQIEVRRRLRESILDSFIHALQERSGWVGRLGRWVESRHWR